MVENMKNSQRAAPVANGLTMKRLADPAGEASAFQLHQAVAAMQPRRYGPGENAFITFLVVTQQDRRRRGIWRLSRDV
jgi:hypothetical protein